MNPARFWSHVRWQGDGCAIWCGNLNDLGYGRVRVEGRLRSAHRVAYELVYGPIPAGAQVRHLCLHEPACVRPDHLTLKMCLTPGEMAQIRRSVLTNKVLADLFRVTSSRISQVRAIPVW